MQNSMVANAPRRKPRILAFPSHPTLSLFLFRSRWNSKAHRHTVAVMKQMEWRRRSDVRLAAGRIRIPRLKHPASEYPLLPAEIRALRAWFRFRGRVQVHSTRRGNIGPFPGVASTR